MNVDDYDNIIYIKDATAHPGETVTLSVILKNKPQVPGYQFDMFLPEGLDVEKDEDNFYRIELSLKRTTAKTPTILTLQNERTALYVYSVLQLVLCLLVTTMARFVPYNLRWVTMWLQIRIP